MAYPGYSVRGTIRVRVLNNAVVSVDCGYGELMITADAQIQNVDLNSHIGSRRAPTKNHPSWRIAFPWNTAQLGTSQTIFKPGNIVSFEVIRNPEDAVGSQTLEVVVETTVGQRESTQKPADVDRWSITGEGGDWYTEQTGRLGLPSPFSSSP